MVVVFLCWLGTRLSFAAGQSPVETTGTLQGTVIDRQTRRPIDGAVVLVDGTPLNGVTGPDGRFSVAGVPAGVRMIRAEASGYAPLVTAEVSIAAGRVSALAVELLPAPRDFTEEVNVVGALTVLPPGVTTTSYGMTPEDIRRSAGSFGGDLNRAVQALPGLAVGDGRNDLIVRGGNPTENLTLVDGIEVPNLNHFGSANTTGGAYSMLNNELLSDVKFLAGGFPAQYGNRLSSVLDVRLRDGNRTRATVDGDFNFIGAALVGEGPLGSHGSWIGSVRRSFVDLIASATSLGSSVPQMTSYTFKGSFDLGPRDKVWFLGIAGQDSYARKVDPADLSQPSLQSVDIHGWRSTTGAAWQRLFGQKAYGVLTVSDSASDQFARSQDRQLSDRVVFLDDSRYGETTVRYDFSSNIGRSWSTRTGGSWKRLRGRLNVSTPLGIQSPYSTAPDRVDSRDVDMRTAAELAGGYFEASGRIAPRTTVIMGSRIDRFQLIGATAVSPHAGIEVELSPQVKLELSAGRYHQQPDLLALSSVPENQRLSPIAADHLVLGVTYAPRADLHFSIETYDKRYHQVPVSVEHPTFTLANTGAQFSTTEELLFPMVDAGKGRVRGVELFVKKTLTDRTYGQIAYSYSRSENAALDGVFRPGAFDTPHILTVLGGYRLGHGWDFSGRFSVSSGRPYTPALMPESFQQDRWIFDLSRVNAGRLPTYHRLDLRFDRQFTLGNAHLAFFGEVQNVYNQRTVIAYEWNAKSDQQQGQRQIGRLPILGLTIKF
jgi:hypothetical protein